MPSPAGVRVLLASASPRRAQILAGLGLPFEVIDSAIDDGELTPPDNATAASWTIAMAYLKARAAINGLTVGTPGVVMGADTSCELGGQIIGKPATAQDAARTLRAMSGRTQRVVTGVALVDPAHPRTHRVLIADTATVTFGDLDDAMIEAYVATDAWRGKAGGYNLSERVAEGWPVAVAGDPDTVVGLPARRLHEWLDRTRGWGSWGGWA